MENQVLIPEGKRFFALLSGCVRKKQPAQCEREKRLGQDDRGGGGGGPAARAAEGNAGPASFLARSSRALSDGPAVFSGTP